MEKVVSWPEASPIDAEMNTKGALHPVIIVTPLPQFHYLKTCSPSIFSPFFLLNFIICPLAVDIAGV